MDKQLITQQELGKYRPTGKLEGTRVDPFIMEAQLSDLKPVLNDALYLDFIKKVFDTGAGGDYTKYQELLKGKDWAYNGQTVRFYGVEPMLAYYSLARFCIGNPVNYVRYGMVQKSINQSEPVAPEVLREEVRNLKSVAVGYQNSLILFLQQNKVTYPLYSFNESCDMPSRTGFKMYRG